MMVGLEVEVDKLLYKLKPQSQFHVRPNIHDSNWMFVTVLKKGVPEMLHQVETFGHKYQEG